MKLSFPTTVLLLISFLNLGSLAYSLHLDMRTPPDFEFSRPRFAWTTPLALIVAFLSQLLYLVLLAAWLFHWVRFYPGNPPVMHTISLGCLLSFSGVITGVYATGARRWAAVFVSIVTFIMWMLSAAASVAV